MRNERVRSGTEGPADERELWAEALFERLHPLMAWLAGVFILVIIGDTIVRDESPFATIFTVAGWIIWAIFVLDFALRLRIAPSKRRFLRRNWWQILFLLLPFLALFRAFLALRVARAGRLLSAAVRGTRSAAKRLGSRLGTIAALTLMIILFSANVLFEFGEVTPYGRALHDAALATIAGEPTSSDAAIAEVMDVVLALYSVVVFATVAGSLGAYFLERDPA